MFSSFFVLYRHSNNIHPNPYTLSYPIVLFYCPRTTVIYFINTWLKFMFRVTECPFRDTEWPFHVTEWPFRDTEWRFIINIKQNYLKINLTFARVFT